LTRAVLFDFDGVMADTPKWHVRAWQQILKSIGIDIEPKQVYLNEGQPARVIVARLAQRGESQLSQAEAIQLANRKNKIFRAINKAKPADGATELLTELKARGIKCALVTGTVVENLLNVLGEKFLSQFDTVVTETDVERGKPLPDPYLLAARQLDVDASECVVVENSPSGIQAAKAAGMRCVALTTTLSPDDLDGADYLFGSLRELLDGVDDIVR
jgi:beta-phosphoglucomutase